LKILTQIEGKALSEVTQRIHNEITKKAYLYQLRCYLSWTGKKSYDELIVQTNEETQRNLEDYCRYLQQEKHSRSFYNLIFSALTFFYEINFKVINRTRIRTMILPNEDKIGGEAYTNDDIKKILQAIDQTKKKDYKIHTKLRSKAMIHLLASSGIRVGSLRSLHVKDLSKIENCYSFKVYSGSVYEHHTFLTPEATKIVDEYLKERESTWVDKMENRSYYSAPRLITFQDSLVFDMSLEAIRLSLSRIVRKAKLQESKIGKRYDKPLNHAYRKRFNTILKSNKEVNRDLAELMLGHTLIKLDSAYLKPTKETLFNEFRKIIPELTIFQHVS